MKLICPHCQTEFYVTRGLLKEYVYKTLVVNEYGKDMIYFCSYSCWRNHGKIETTKDVVQESR
jgi:hypothetical protein